MFWCEQPNLALSPIDRDELAIGYSVGGLFDARYYGYSVLACHDHTVREHPTRRKLSGESLSCLT